MINQTFVSFYPPVAFPGEDHNNTRHTAIYRSCVNTTLDLVAGTVQVKTGIYDHTRLLLSNPTAVNLAAAGNYVVFVAKTMAERMSYTSRSYIGSTVSSATNIIPRNEHVRGLTNGIMYMIVEKAINPNNPVYVRVANPVGSLQAIGYLTDVASADVVLLPKANWYGSDTATYLATKDATVTPALEAQRIGLSTGFGVAPVALRFGSAI
jgi:hypothetical protein